MNKKNFYTIPIKVVQRFSSTVVVKASSAAEAKRILDKEFRESDYLYDKTTDCPDDTSVSVGKATLLSENEVNTAMRAHLCSDSIDFPYGHL